MKKLYNKKKCICKKKEGIDKEEHVQRVEA